MLLMINGKGQQHERCFARYTTVDLLLETLSFLRCDLFAVAKESESIRLKHFGAVRQ